MHEFVAFKIYCQLNVMMQQFLKSCLVIIQNYFIFITVSHWADGCWLCSLGEKSLVSFSNFPLCLLSSARARHLQPAGSGPLLTTSLAATLRGK